MVTKATNTEEQLQPGSGYRGANSGSGESRTGYLSRLYRPDLIKPDLLRKHQGDRSYINLSYPRMKSFGIMSLESWWESCVSDKREMQQMQLMKDG